MQELQSLEEQGKRIEDVAELKSQLQENYYDWFRITQFKSASELNNIAWKDTQIFTLKPNDIETLWTPISINIPSNSRMMIAWNKWAIIDASSDTSRWTLRPYNLSNNLEGCITALNSNWIYCYNNGWDIYMISKSAGIVPVWTEDWDFRSGIGWLWTYNSRNLYVFQSNVSSLGNMLLTRYQTNNDWTYANFKWWSSYSIDASWVNFGTFSSFSIDGNFYGIADWKIYQFWREDVAWTSLRYRQINIKWSNPLTEKFSSNTKIMVNKDSRYIYIYDKDQQLLTVYNSDPNKMNNTKITEFQLVYLFSLKFDIEWITVYDVDVPNSTWDRPEAYLLTSNGVNRIALYEYIEAIN